MDANRAMCALFFDYFSDLLLSRFLAGRRPVKLRRAPSADTGTDQQSDADFTRLTRGQAIAVRHEELY